uniref:Ribosomal protein S14 n=1 Tax=Tetrahymena rostrata TaxID=5909 RepID=A0A650DE24_TETRO|nr:ribosomal protein S14 [Tetrahymena rostrata]QBI37883.1 ribosomal protein S14 [Tetrahymena rostrata]QBI37927.1 ribosomal protein S14 [Tetrahymena rostrata]QGS65260.1 ribosomal protein S14 [Tetrahymena rostrata]URP31117.1 ribosomal protein S14 [Tetrahymena rostrata]
MLIRRRKNTLKSKYKKIYIYRNKLKNIILKSLFYNRNIKTLNRSYSYMILNNNKILYKKYHKICKFNGYRKNVNKFTGIGRHELNRKGTLGQLQNISLNSW